jgi:hypothetical protein
VPSLPPALAFHTARQLHQAALVAQRPSGLKIGGVLYECAVERGPVEFIPLDGGSARGQRLRAHVLKSKLPTAPNQKSLVTHNDVEFKVQDIGGQNATDVAWIIRCVRWID